MLYSNILWLTDDKIALCSGDLCFKELDFLVVPVLQCHALMFPFQLHPGQMKELKELSVIVLPILFAST